MPAKFLIPPCIYFTDREDCAFRSSDSVFAGADKSHLNELVKGHLHASHPGLGSSKNRTFFDLAEITVCGWSWKVPTIVVSVIPYNCHASNQWFVLNRELGYCQNERYRRRLELRNRDLTKRFEWQRGRLILWTWSLNMHLVGRSVWNLDGIGGFFIRVLYISVFTNLKVENIFIMYITDYGEWW